MTSLATMKLILALLISISICRPGYSNSLNELETRIGPGEADGNKAERLLRQAKGMYQKDPTKAVDLVTEAILLGIKEKDERIQAEGYQLLGEINYHIEQYDLAIANYQRSLEIYQNSSSLRKKIGRSRGIVNKEEKVLRLYKLMGDTYEKSGQLDEALKYYQLYIDNSTTADSKREELKSKTFSQSKEPIQVQEKSERDFKASDDNDQDNTTELQEVQLAISNIYNKQKQFELSKDNIISASGFSADTTSYTIEGNISSNSARFNYEAGNILLEQGDSQAVSYYNSTYKQAELLNRPDIAAQAVDKMAEWYSVNDRIEESKKLRYRNIEILEEAEDQDGLADQYLEIGILDLKLGEEDSAEQAFGKALSIGEALGDLEVQQKSLKEMADLAESKGDIDKALDYFKSFSILQDSSILLKEAELERKLDLNFTSVKQQQKVDLLQKNEEINEKTIEILRQNDKNQKILIYSLLGGILLLGGSGYLMYKNMRQRRIANQLIALRSLRSQMNPHFIFNALNSVNLYISQKDERTANKYLTDFSRLMRSVLEQSQKDFISLQQELDMISLYLRLEHDRFKDKFNYSLEIDDELDVENIMLPPMLIQPYIENAIWHGLRYKEEIGELKVKYTLNSHKIVVSIEDNGIGRQKSAELKTKNQLKTKSTGMDNIQNRLKIINDMFKTQIELSITDLDENHGTRVIVQIPIEKSGVEV